MRAFRICLLAAAAAVASPSALATAQRTFVASNGNDFNACSLAAPCRSFGAAMAQTNPGGEIVVLDSAGYGKVTITQSVSIIVPPGIYGGISVFSGDNGVTVNAPGGTVVLRGLSITGQGGWLGVEIQAADRVRIEGCVISGMASNGISHHADGAELIVLDTVVRDNGGTGIGMAADAVVVLDHVRSEHNYWDGFYIAPSASEASATIVDSVFARNRVNGIWVDSLGGAKTLAHVARATLSNNGTGMLARTVAANAVENLVVTDTVVSGSNGDGILMTSSAGSVWAALRRNSVSGNKGYGVHSDGAGTVYVSLVENVARDAASYSFGCTNATTASMASFGGNVGGTYSVASCLQYYSSW